VRGERAGDAYYLCICRRALARLRLQLQLELGCSCTAAAPSPSALQPAMLANAHDANPDPQVIVQQHQLLTHSSYDGVYQPLLDTEHGTGRSKRWCVGLNTVYQLPVQPTAVLCRFSLYTFQAADATSFTSTIISIHHHQTLNPKP